ncbi:unnamed protein product [Amoebophrya sp. A120]|nr:unnamed protein product [Amoebophrya sp. A120]|eukprot:GSA120T00007704001.1
MAARSKLPAAEEHARKTGEDNYQSGGAGNINFNIKNETTTASFSANTAKPTNLAKKHIVSFAEACRILSDFVAGRQQEQRNQEQVEQVEHCGSSNKQSGSSSILVQGPRRDEEITVGVFDEPGYLTSRDSGFWRLQHSRESMWRIILQQSQSKREFSSGDGLIISGSEDVDMGGIFDIGGAGATTAAAGGAFGGLMMQDVEEAPGRKGVPTAGNKQLQQQARLQRDEVVLGHSDETNSAVQWISGEPPDEFSLPTRSYDPYAPLLGPCAVYGKRDYKTRTIDVDRILQLGDFLPLVKTTCKRNRRTPGPAARVTTDKSVEQGEPGASSTSNMLVAEQRPPRTSKRRSTSSSTFMKNGAKIFTLHSGFLQHDTKEAALLLLLLLQYFHQEGGDQHEHLAKGADNHVDAEAGDEIVCGQEEDIIGFGPRARTEESKNSKTREGTQNFACRSRSLLIVGPLPHPNLMALVDVWLLNVKNCLSDKAATNRIDVEVSTVNFPYTTYQFCFFYCMKKLAFEPNITC